MAIVSKNKLKEYDGEKYISNYWCVITILL